MAASIWNPGGLASPALPAVAPVAFVPGLGSAPGITFVGDTDTGVWSQANGYINFTVNGVDRLVIDPLGNVSMSGKLVTGVEVDVVAAAVIDLGAVVSNSVRITGTATVTSFGVNYKGPVYIRFAAALALQNSVTLILPGASNISVSAGDSCIVMPKATAGVSDGWVVVAYQRASGSGGSGATGAAGNFVFYENDQTITGDYTLSNGKNAITAGPITINTGITVTVPTGATWSIV